MANSVSFFTPIESKDYPLFKVVDYLFWFGGHVAVHVQPDRLEEGSHLCTQSDQYKTNWVATTLKIVAMIATLGILPLLALALKSIIRCCHSFHYEVPKQPLPDNPPPRANMAELLRQQQEALLRDPVLANIANAGGVGRPAPAAMDRAAELLRQQQEALLRNPALANIANAGGVGRPAPAAMDRAAELLRQQQEALLRNPVLANIANAGGVERPAPEKPLRLDPHVVLKHISHFIQDEERYRGLIQNCVDKGRAPPDAMLIRQRSTTDALHLLNQLSVAEITGEFAHNPVLEHLNGSLALLPPDQVLTYYGQVVANPRENLFSLEGEALVRRLYILVEREIGLVGARRLHREQAEIEAQQLAEMKVPSGPRIEEVKEEENPEVALAAPKVEEPEGRPAAEAPSEVALAAPKIEGSEQPAAEPSSDGEKLKSSDPRAEARYRALAALAAKAAEKPQVNQPD